MVSRGPTKLLRTFIAVELPSKICQYLNHSAEQLTADLPPKTIRWVAPNNIHLTLRFLGDTPENKVPEISAALDTITNRFHPFTLNTNQMGAFPNQKRPRVIWASLDGQLKSLINLQSQIEIAVQSLGWDRDKRPFRPHLTIGRVKNYKHAQNLDWGVHLERQTYSVTAVNLIESQLRPTGPLYTIRHSSILGRN